MTNQRIELTIRWDDSTRMEEPVIEEYYVGEPYPSTALIREGWDEPIFHDEDGIGYRIASHRLFDRMDEVLALVFVRCVDVMKMKPEHEMFRVYLQMAKYERFVNEYRRLELEGLNPLIVVKH